MSRVVYRRPAKVVFDATPKLTREVSALGSRARTFPPCAAGAGPGGGRRGGGEASRRGGRGGRSGPEADRPGGGRGARVRRRAALERGTFSPRKKLRRGDPGSKVGVENVVPEAARGAGGPPGL